LNGKFSDEFFDGEIFHLLRQAKVLTERWRYPCNPMAQLLERGRVALTWN
jgi:hypothetical protein